VGDAQRRLGPGGSEPPAEVRGSIAKREQRHGRVVEAATQCVPSRAVPKRDTTGEAASSRCERPGDYDVAAGIEADIAYLARKSRSERRPGSAVPDSHPTQRRSPSLGETPAHDERAIVGDGHGVHLIVEARAEL
jgi:hypothetical protein